MSISMSLSRRLTTVGGTKCSATVKLVSKASAVCSCEVVRAGGLLTQSAVYKREMRDLPSYGSFSSSNPSKPVSDMKLLSTILAIAPSLVASVQAQSPSCGCTPNISYTDSTYHGYILDRYVALWGGNYSLLDTVVSPDVGYYQDQLPVYGHVPIYNSSQLLGFIEASRDGWSSFGFVGQYWISEGYKIAFRYTFEGILSNASLQYPTA